MKVTLIQMDIVWDAPEVNRETAERLMLSAEKSDLYVLPEMWDTGCGPYQSSPNGGSTTLLWMQQMANRLDAAVAGSLAIHLPDGTYRNRLYFVTSQENGQWSMANGQWYDKHHLFAYGGETERFSPGNKRVTVEWRDVRFSLSVCYDLRFPIWLRNCDDYDVLICVASWPEARLHAWNVLLQARAIENQCYVLGVNRIGKDPYCQYNGGTAVVDPFGFAEACPEGEAFALTKTLDMKRLKSFRTKFPVLAEIDR